MRLARFKAIFLALFFLGSILIFLPAAPAAGENVPLTEIKAYIKDFYVEEVDEEILRKERVEEIFQALGDPYSFYMDPKAFGNFLISTDQVYSGVGLQVETRDGYITVVKVFPDTPAEKVGLRPGDRIVSVNGLDVRGKAQGEVVELIRGEPGTVVLLGISRPGEQELLLFSITRAVIQLQPLQKAMLEKGIGYIKLDSFTPTASEEFDEAIEALRQEGMEGLIFDLRGNAGGYLSSALGIGADFAGVGEPLLHVVNREGKMRSYRSLTPAFSFPVVILVDRNSASASEVVAGIAQDYGTGILVGTRTFGKASVQSVFPLSNGGGLKLTTAKYLTPKEREINGVGLEPDYLVEDPEEQLARAVEMLKKEIGSRPGRTVIRVFLREGKGEVNGQEVAITPVPYEAGGRVFVPLRFLEHLGATVSWDGTNRQATASIDGKSLILGVGQKEARWAGQVRVLERAPE
ncbi:MAG: PDZ domain-containing protein, partial [Clostridia bacterium]|nr:PDZ domain-containing protein [Clostridia bacterium]